MTRPCFASNPLLWTPHNFTQPLSIYYAWVGNAPNTTRCCSYTIYVASDWMKTVGTSWVKCHRTPILANRIHPSFALYYLLCLGRECTNTTRCSYTIIYVVLERDGTCGDHIGKIPHILHPSPLIFQTLLQYHVLSLHYCHTVSSCDS